MRATTENRNLTQSVLMLKYLFKQATSRFRPISSIRQENIGTLEQFIIKHRKDYVDLHQTTEQERDSTEHENLKSSSLFGESLRLVPRSSLQVLNTKNALLVTKCEIGDSLEEFLTKATPDKGLVRLLMCMGEALRTIAFKVRTASCGGTACVNSFGDEQLAVDMLANKLLFEALTYSHFCKYACSEEVPELQDMGGPAEGGFSVAFDPLDGSSIVDTNFSVGTIFGVWPGDKLIGVKGRDQVAAAMGIYGPRTTYVLALKDYPGTHEFLLLDEGKWQHVKETTEVGEGKLFSPGNLRATFDNPDYDKLISYYVKEKYTLRYTGGMVPDVNQIIVKEKGVFTNVTSPSSKAKLRLLFEVAPLGLLVEKAGGYSSDGYQSVLHKEIKISTIELKLLMDPRMRSSGLKKLYMGNQDSRLVEFLLELLLKVKVLASQFSCLSFYVFALEGAEAKWRGSVGGIVDAPIDKVWTIVSETKRLLEWMPMVERCTDLEGDEGVPGYVRLVSGFMFPQQDGERSWIKERLVSMDFTSHSYAYKMEASNVGLDGSVNTLRLVDYGDDSTLVNWSLRLTL
ncbi:hypothetical protein GH714_036779 [Hevea brasiliensis]|uniref:Sedoheptulose-1,7-bisphosphatase, chloroplastic n=1 Tax=Hevea brasiliensis TaxID=3981 RepID=A0A6A6L6Y8_HEVBR|nr:hypothetical protein GH714_036779 [Hevea brasiliensis]